MIHKILINIMEGLINLMLMNSHKEEMNMEVQRTDYN